MSIFTASLFKFARCIAPISISSQKFCIYYDFDKKCAEPDCNLKNRSLTSTRKLSGDEIISVLESALGLKAVGMPNKLLQENSIHFLVEQCCIVNLLSAIKGGTDMGASIITVYSNTLCTKKQSKRDLSELGRFISELYNVICVASYEHAVVEGIADGSQVPVINIGSCFYSPIDAFSFALTLFETFQKVGGLTVGIIASPNSYVNSMICLLPRIGVNVRLICIQNNQAVSVRFFDLAQRFTKFNSTTLVECKTVAEVVEGANCIVLACEEHLKTKLVLKDFDKSAKDWKIASKLPGEHPLEKGILENERNISYNVMKNTHHIYAALYLRLLGIDFKHEIKIK